MKTADASGVHGFSDGKGQYLVYLLPSAHLRLEQYLAWEVL